jgi:hypothetical protein
MQLTPELQRLKQRFIVPVEAVADLLRPRKRMGVFEYFYCPYAPCCSQCVGIFTFREALDHLRRVHQHSTERIKKLVREGLPTVSTRERQGK